MEFSFSTAENQIGIYNLQGSLIGETDGLSITESLNEKLEEGYKQYVIDLEKLQHINSSGLGVLITLLTKARKIGGEVILANPSAYIKNLLLITKLNTIFQVHPTVNEAIESYKSQV
ncbi:MAG: STAS domain-containing protein [Bacteroidota bacterium]